jgi:hypothetical protein
MNDNDVMITITMKLQRDGAIRTTYDRSLEVNPLTIAILEIGMLTSCIQHIQTSREEVLNEGPTP